MRKFHVWCEDCDYRAVLPSLVTAKSALIIHRMNYRHRVIGYELKPTRKIIITGAKPAYKDGLLKSL